MIFKFILIVSLSLLLHACGSGQVTTSEGLGSAPKSPADVFVKLGKQYIARGQLGIALGELKKAMAIDPRNSEAHNAIAVLYERLGEDQLAGDHYQKSTRLFPSNAGAQNNFGRYLCARQQYEEAQQRFRLAYENPLYQKSWFALTNAGRCALQSGKLADAERFLRKSLQFNRRFPPTLLEMAKLNLKKQNFLSARAFIQRYESVAAATSESLWVGIQTERKLNDPEAVSKYARQLLAKYPNSDEAGFYRSSR